MENTQDSIKKTTTKEPFNCPTHGAVEIVIFDNPFGDTIKGSCSLCMEDSVNEEKEHKLIQRRSMVQDLLNNADIPKRFKDATLGNYVVEDPRQQKALDSVNWFLDHFQNSTGLIIIGNPGTGKLHLAVGIAKEVVKRFVKPVKITEVVKLDRKIKDSWADKSTTRLMRRLAELELLVIDEVGVQSGSDTEIRHLTEVINDRYNAMKPTILIGNVTIDQIEKLVGDRPIDRFREGGKVVACKWKSWRERIGKIRTEKP